ncbi:MAG: sulfatase-like hydrolase/transferase [Polyangiaceae bacterium]
MDHGGSTFQPIVERKYVRDFWLDDATTSLRVRARVFGRNGTAVSASIDGKRLGRLKLTRATAEVLTFPRLVEPLNAGRHTLLLESHGRASPQKEAFYDLDWLNFTDEEEPSKNYAPPTARDLVADQELKNVPRRAIVLRAPSHVRCPLHLASSTRLDVSLGFWGTGTGTAEVAIVEEGHVRTTLHERRVNGGPDATWIPVTLDLSPFAGRVVSLELRSVQTTLGGRIAFGEPRLNRPEGVSTPTPKASTIVVVVASGIDRRLVPPWGAAGENSALTELLRDSVAFHAYRTPTTVPAGILATLLTGMSPARHHVVDTAARLGNLPTLGVIAKHYAARTAMFTGVPTSFPAFGFNVGWDTYGSYSPVLDIPAETPIVEATRYLAQRIDQNRDGLRFVLVHARGAHPPWDLTKEQTAQLAPADYGGALDARRGGITLGKIRRQTAKVQRRLNDEDTERLSAFMKAGLAKQNPALANLIATLKRRELWDETLFVFVGDTANAELPNLPFDPLGALREDQLTVPLIVKFPGRLFAGKTYERPVTTVDLARTIFDAVDPSTTEPIEGIDLIDGLSGREPLLTRTLVSTLGQKYVSRTGVWLLSGELGSVPRLCQTDVDPMCVDDQFAKVPMTAQALFRWTAAELSRAHRAGAKTQREPASIDPETAAALTVWGDVEM